MSTAGAIRAGKAFVQFFLDDNELTRGLSRAEKKISNFGKSIASFGAKTFAFGAAALAPFALATKSFADAGSAIQDMVERTGMTAEEVSRLGFVARQSATDVEALVKGIVSLNRMMVEAAQGSKSARGALEELGLSYEALLHMTPHDRLLIVADALSRIPDVGVRAAKAMEVFGRSGIELLPFISNGAAGIRALEEQANQLGITMSGDAAKRADELGDRLQALWEQFAAVKNAIGSAIAEAILPYMGAIQSAVAATIQWVRDNKELVTLVVGATVAIAALGKVITVVGVAITAFGAVLGLIAAMANPLGIAIAGVAALGLTWANMSISANESLGQIWAIFQEVFGLIVALIKAGDISGAWELAIDLLKNAWDAGLLHLKMAWTNLTGKIASVWQETIAGMKIAWESFASWVADGQDWIASKFLNEAEQATLNEMQNARHKQEEDIKSQIASELTAEQSQLSEDLSRRRAQLLAAQNEASSKFTGRLNQARERVSQNAASEQAGIAQPAVDFGNLDFSIQSRTRDRATANSAVRLQSSEAQRAIISALGFGERDKNVKATNDMKTAVVGQLKDLNKKMKTPVFLEEV